MLNKLKKPAQIIVIIILMLVYITKFVFVYANIPTGSMRPLLEPGDKVIANFFPYNVLGQPKRFDILIFKTPEFGTEFVTKRLIGLPGDKIQIISGTLYINDVKTDEPYLLEAYEGDYGPYNVPSDSFFFLGDNRNGSHDARFWEDPFIKRKDIKGIILYEVTDEIEKLF